MHDRDLIPGLAEDRFRPGAAIHNGRYLLQRLIGQGSHGRVFAAHDHERAVRVALKVLRETEAASQFRLKREFRALANLRHPNLGRMHELCSEAGRLFLTMELVEGPNFVTWVRGANDVGTTWHRLRAGLAQLACGLDALHADGKLHRDLKPSNLLVDRHGRVVVVDFGLIDETRSHVGLQERNGAGTRRFLAPECRLGRPAVPASDWFSVGVILYLAATGEFPSRLSDSTVEARLRATESMPDDLLEITLALLDASIEARLAGAALARRLASPAIASRSGDELLGRDAELDRLRASLARVEQGIGVRCFVEGPSGIGKSTLVRTFLQEATRAGAIVLAGTCHEFDTVPYKALDTIIDELSRYLNDLSEYELRSVLPSDRGPLARMFPVLTRVAGFGTVAVDVDDGLEPRLLKRRALDALRTLLRRIAEHHPLVLFIDNLQWGDLDSVDLLLRLLGPPDPPPLMLLAADRCSALGSSATALALLSRIPSNAAGSYTERIGLATLSPQHTELMISRHLGVPDATQALCAALAAASGGNPWLALELAQLHRGKRMLAPLPEEPTRLAAALMRARLARLPETALELLELAAITARPLPRAVLRATLPATPAEFRSAIELLGHERFIQVAAVEASGLVEICHDRIREAVAAVIEPSRLRRHHARLAAALQHADTQLPEHYAIAGQHIAAGLAALRAGDAAASVLAFDRAVHFYVQAERELAGTELQPANLARKIADALALAERRSEAASAYLKAAELAPDLRGAVDGLNLAAVQAQAAGDPATAERAFERLFERVGLPWPAARRLTLLRGLLAWLSWITWFCVASLLARLPKSRMRREQLEALRTASEVISIHRPWRGSQLRLRFAWAAPRSGDPALLATAYIWWANVTLCIIPLRRCALPAHALATRLASRAGDPHVLVVAMAHQAFAHFWAGDYARAVELARQAEQLAKNLPGAATMAVYTMSIRLLAENMRGNLRAVCSERAELAIRAQEVGTNLDVVGFEAAAPLLSEDRIEDAQRLIAQLQQRLQDQPRSELVRLSVLWVECEVAAYAGDSDRAWQLGDTIFQKASVAFRLLAWFYLLTCRGRVALLAAVETGRPDARAAVGECARALLRMRQPHARAYARFLFAGEAALAGKQQRAYELLGEAARDFSKCGMQMLAQAVHGILGRQLGGEAGASMIREAEAFMRSQVANPTRYADFLLGGLPRLL